MCKLTVCNRFFIVVLILPFLQVREIEQEVYAEPVKVQQKDTKPTAASDLSKRLKDFRNINDAASLKGDHLHTFCANELFCFYSAIQILQFSSSKKKKSAVFNQVFLLSICYQSSIFLVAI